MFAKNIYLCQIQCERIQTIAVFKERQRSQVIQCLMKLWIWCMSHKLWWNVVHCFLVYKHFRHISVSLTNKWLCKGFYFSILCVAFDLISFFYICMYFWHFILKWKFYFERKIQMLLCYVHQLYGALRQLPAEDRWTEKRSEDFYRTVKCLQRGNKVWDLLCIWCWFNQVN